MIAYKTKFMVQESMFNYPKTKDAQTERLCYNFKQDQHSKAYKPITIYNPQS